MTQQEFTSLTGVRVDEREFDAIHIVYMASDMDKFDFCNTWCKMNKSRVRSAKEQAIRVDNPTMTEKGFAAHITDGTTRVVHVRVIWAAEYSVLVTPHTRYIATQRTR